MKKELVQNCPIPRLTFLSNSILTFTVDNVSCGKVINDKYTKREDWPFNDYFYFIINLAVGGDWAGEIADKDLLFIFIIDYIKVYQK